MSFKVFIALALSLVLALGLCVTGFAADAVLYKMFPSSDSKDLDPISNDDAVALVVSGSIMDNSDVIPLNITGASEASPVDSKVLLNPRYFVKN